MRNYDANNIFAKILRGELPSHKVYEDDETLAFMDIMPRCEGHTLVVPKTPARNVLDANPAQLAACMKTVQKVSVARWSSTCTSMCCRGAKASRSARTRRKWKSRKCSRQMLRK